VVDVEELNADVRSKVDALVASSKQEYINAVEMLRGPLHKQMRVMFLFMD